MTQRISDHDLLARVLNVHDADRLGKVSQEEVSHILSAYSDCEDNVAEHDLLSLRAAVRRVHAAEDAIRKHRGASTALLDQLLLERERAQASLRAEMAGIDKDGGA